MQENQELLKKIEPTINLMEDDPNKVYTSWVDQSKGRKEKAKLFQEFDHGKDEFVKACRNHSRKMKINA